MFVAAACSSSKNPPASSPDAAGDGGGASTPSPTPAGGSSCTADSDCRTFSNYCPDTPCSCEVLAKKEADPACTGQVSCVVDPCMRKTAACQGGRCVLVMAN